MRFFSVPPVVIRLRAREQKKKPTGSSIFKIVMCLCEQQHIVKGFVLLTGRGPSAALVGTWMA